MCATLFWVCVHLLLPVIGKKSDQSQLEFWSFAIEEDERRGAFFVDVK